MCIVHLLNHGEVNLNTKVVAIQERQVSEATLYFTSDKEFALSSLTQYRESLFHVKRTADTLTTETSARYASH